MITVENYLKDKEVKARYSDKSLTPTGIMKANNLLDVKNLVLHKKGAVPEIKKYLTKLPYEPELKTFLSDISIILVALSRKHKQTDERFEQVFLDGKPDADSFTISLTDAQRSNLQKLNLNQKELNNVGKNFGELLSGLFLLNRFEPLAKISYPLKYTATLIDFLAIQDNGLEYKISAKYNEGAPAAISALMKELKPYVDKHKSESEDKVEQFVLHLFKALQDESNPVLQIFQIWNALEYFIPETKSYFVDLKNLKNTPFASDKPMTAPQVADYIVKNRLNKDIFNLFKKIVFLLNNHKEIKKVFNKWIMYANVHQVYLFNFNISPDYKTVTINFKIKAFKHEDSKFQFDTKVSLKEPWKNGLNFSMIYA